MGRRRLTPAVRPADHQEFGGAGLCDCVRVEVARALLAETWQHRARLHRARPDAPARCDTAITVAGTRIRFQPHAVRPGDASGAVPAVCESHVPGSRRGGPTLRISGVCPCGSFLLDVFREAHEYLVAEGPRLRNPPAAARRHIRCRQHDHTRWTRRERGAQVRTDRIESSARARALTAEQRQLLADIVDEAGLDSPLEDDDQLVRRLAVRRARRTGGDPDALVPAVRSDRAVVAAHVAAGPLVNVGTRTQPELVSWWEAYVERPLGRRPRLFDARVSTVPQPDDETGARILDVSCPGSDDGFALVVDRMVVPGVACDEDPADRIVLATLRHAVREDTSGDLDRVLETTLRWLAANDLLTRARVDDVLADSTRRSHAVAALASATC